MAKRTITRYRDRDTGRFVSKSTWTRSRTHSGTRYKREYGKPPKTKEKPEEEIERKPIIDLDELEEFLEESDEETIDIEFEGAFDSP